MRLLVFLAALLTAVPALSEETHYGTLHLQRPAGAMRGLVILFSRGSGWTAVDQQAAEALAAEGALVAGVETGAYLAAIGTAECHVLDGDAWTLARQLQRGAGTQRFFTPLLAGAGEGGALAGRVLAQAPPNTVAGAISVDPAAGPALAALPCGTGATPPNGFWDIATTPAGGSEAGQLRALAMPHLAMPRAEANDMSDLPLIELPAGKPTDMLAPTGMLAIVLAGDGGWRDIDKSLAEALVREGVSVIGLDSLRYFWRERSPEQVAATIERILRSAMVRRNVRHVALIGYSFGADVLPFAYTRLPAGLRGEVELLSLLEPSIGADFEIRIVGWLGAAPSAQARPLAPELARVPPRVVQCVYGADDAGDSVCPALADIGMRGAGTSGIGAEVVRLPGGHHFGGDYEALARRILQAWRERMGQSASDLTGGQAAR